MLKIKKDKLIIFDFDGVIVNTFSISFGLSKTNTNKSEDEFRKKFEGNFFKPSTEAKESEINYDFFALYAPLLMKTQPESGMIEIIKKLSENYILTIISSTLTELIEDYLEKFGIRNYFQEILGPDIERSKVKKIQTIFKNHATIPQKAIFITDTLGDIREGKECGLLSIAVTWGYHPQETLSIGEPYKIINKPEEIVEIVEAYFQGQSRDLK